MHRLRWTATTRLGLITIYEEVRKCSEKFFPDLKKINFVLATIRLCLRQSSEGGLDFRQTLGGVEREDFEVLPLLSEQQEKRGLGIYPQLNVIMTGVACQYHY